MAKMLGERATFNRLNKYLEERFSEDERYIMEFHSDIEREEFYAWKFNLYDKTHVLELNRLTKSIDHRIFPKI